MKLHFDISPEEDLIFVNALKFQHEKTSFEQQSQIQEDEREFILHMDIEHGKFVPESNIHPIFENIFNQFEI